MDTTTLIIVILASLLFFGVLIYKALWLIRKVQEAPEDSSKSPESVSALKKSAEPASQQESQ